MTQAQARKLKLGDQVKWIGDVGTGESEADCRSHIGTVNEVGEYLVRVKWDDGIYTSHYFAQPAQCGQLERVA